MKADKAEHHKWTYETTKASVPVHECVKCGYRMSIRMTPGTLPSTKHRVRIFGPNEELLYLSCDQYLAYRIHEQ